MLTGLAQRVQYLKFLANQNSPVILAGVAVTGTVATAYLTGRASFKAAKIINELEVMHTEHRNHNGPDDENAPMSRVEKVREVWRLYLPPVAIGITTIAAIIVAHRINSKRLAALAVASGISERALQEYKEKVVQKLGETKARNLRDEIAQDRVSNQPLGREIILAGTGDVLCFDMTTGRYFVSSVEDIKRAENKINHELNNFMSASLSQFYDEIGLPPTTYSDNVGWNGNNQVEIHFSTVMSPDNRPCVAIDFANQPISDYHRVYD